MTETVDVLFLSSSSASAQKNRDGRDDGPIIGLRCTRGQLSTFWEISNGVLSNALFHAARHLQVTSTDILVVEVDANSDVETFFRALKLYLRNPYSGKRLD